MGPVTFTGALPDLFIPLLTVAHRYLPLPNVTSQELFQSAGLDIDVISKDDPDLFRCGGKVW